MEQTDAQLWALAVGTFLPLLIAAILRQGWTSRSRELAAFGICMAAAAGTAYFTDQFTAGGVARAALVVLLAAHTLFRTFWQPSGIAPAIDEATG